jgi:hypothetical protein
MKSRTYAVAAPLIAALGVCVGVLGSPRPGIDMPLAFQGEIMDSVCAQAGSHDDVERNTGITDSEDCVLHCVKDGAQLVLRDSATGTSYRLESGGAIFDENRLAEFAGQKVRIVGSLDENAHLIWHIQSVQRL